MLNRLSRKAIVSAGCYDKVAKGYLFNDKDGVERFIASAGDKDVRYRDAEENDGSFSRMNDDIRYSDEIKKDHSSLGDAVDEYPLSGHDLKPEGTSHSKVNSTKDSTKLQHNSIITKKKP